MLSFSFLTDNNYWFFSIIAAKCLYSGISQNIFNLDMIRCAVLLISF
ncbi:hypothetical protein K8941_01950 [Buchnera aphidicola (Sitobion miscanthi)]|nr:hypothetical protein [Buchnera aphidicola]MCU4137098.1 hypothetical protein [Buchnera aphidicola (Sitobion miscanthi)]